MGALMVREIRCRPDQARVTPGDARHPTLPFLAQGAVVMAIEDGVVLARSRPCRTIARRAEVLRGGARRAHLQDGKPGARDNTDPLPARELRTRRGPRA